MQNGLEKITRMENLSLKELEQIKRINNLSLNKLKQIAKIRRIKPHKDALKEQLLIALLKSDQSQAELRKSEDNNAELGETKNLFNELRNNFPKEEIEKTRRNFYHMEEINKLEQKDSLNKRKNITPRNYKRLKSFLKS